MNLINIELHYIYIYKLFILKTIIYQSTKKLNYNKPFLKKNENEKKTKIFCHMKSDESQKKLSHFDLLYFGIYQQ